MSLGVFSPGILKIPFLSKFLNNSVVYLRSFDKPVVDAIGGWGLRSSTGKARSYAGRHGLPYIALEDGFLRSVGTGDRYPPLSLVVDDVGIYYDSTRPSKLECLLASDADLLDGIAEKVAQAKALLLTHCLSKYNHAPSLRSDLFLAGDNGRVLVVDQTFGDMSVALGSASAETFQSMLAAARAENPDATIYVKTHPEVSAGRKGGYLTDIQNDSSTVVLREAVNPLSLIAQMDRVYVVTSTMGFEALLAGKLVSVFGLPWYAGWGVTDDRQTCFRRMRHRSIDELFAAAYFHYARYLNPFTKESGTIFDVIDWLLLQRTEQHRLTGGELGGRMICVGFRRWKAVNIKPLLSLDPRVVIFVSDSAAAQTLQPNQFDSLVHWGRDAPNGLDALAKLSGASLVKVEDGFVRSVGLGSDLIPPLSLVLDKEGIYFDPGKESGLENLLMHTTFSRALKERASVVRNFIVKHQLTKYNLDPLESVSWANDSREVVFVPGQVEDDASIRYGCTTVSTNRDLLLAARAAHPDAFIVYKPHPDVLSGNRIGAMSLQDTLSIADHIETRLSVVSCIAACDVLHTMTSLSGFDALLRGKHVVVYGQPFYSGWGLTTDLSSNGAFLRRKRELSIDELVAGVLLLYPMYRDPVLNGFTRCESVLLQLLETRNTLTISGELKKLRVGYLRRQLRKLNILIRNKFGKI